MPPVSEREKMMSMSGLSFVVIFFLTNVASVVFSALVFGVGLVAAHGATRVPDDLFMDEGEVRPRVERAWGTHSWACTRWRAC